jgi:ketosteroid isomerase-like protein
MKTLFFIAALLFCFNYCFCQDADIQKLKQLNATWIASFVTRDTAVMAGIYANDMELVSPDGRIFHKTDLLKNLLSTEVQFSSSRVDSVSVRLLGNIGLVNATATSIGKTKTGEAAYKTCYLDVYEKRNGRWYAVASQVALLSAK